MADVFEDALRFAIEVHSGVMRKSEAIPFILHPLEVATIAATMTTDREVLAAAVLHDVVEDTSHTIDEIEGRFGSRVARLVISETEDKRRDLPPSETWRVRKEESLAALESAPRDVKIIWLADKLSNMRSFHNTKMARGSEMWKDFNQTDPFQHAWYYQRIVELTADLAGETAWQEYNELVHIVFEEELS